MSSNWSLRKRYYDSFSKFKRSAADLINSDRSTERLEAEIKKLKTFYLGRSFPWILNGRQFFSESYYETRDPNSSQTIIGKFPVFSEKQLNDLIASQIEEIRAAGMKFFLENPWNEVRVPLLEAISQISTERFWLLCAAKIYETGQSVSEAVGETDEERDFPIANAVYLEELHNDCLIPPPDFASDISGKCFVPHGVFLDVEPFNFPGAIPMDMATKALAMGNAVILKSSPKASLCGYLVWETIRMAFDQLAIDWRGVVNYAPGGAEVVDAFLSRPEIAGLSFTGSSQVLKGIKYKHRDLLRFGYAGKAELVYGSAETSGVNTFTVCADADLIPAAKEYVASFVGRSGQKCSSARIAFVDAHVFDVFIQETIHMIDDLKYGDVKLGADLGAMITPMDREKLENSIKFLEKAEILRTLYSKTIIKKNEGDFAPTILTPIRKAKDYCPRTIMNTEFFGPVSTIIPFNDLSEVEFMCSLTNFALSGSIFCQNIDTLKRMMRVIPAGNLYWNRKCTGALVETECFGGLRSASSPNGIKGKSALALFGSQQTFSGRYPLLTDKKYKDETITMLINEGMNLSKG